jgi:hypothetical protein
MGAGRARFKSCSSNIAIQGDFIVNRNSVVASLLLAASSFPALASNTLIVNVADDPAGAGTCPAACSLRQAVTTATSGARLVFDPSLASPITLSQGKLVLDKALTIQGPGTAKLTVSANNASQVLIVSAQVSISGLTLADGFITGTAGSNGAAGASGASGVPGGPGGTGGPGGLAGGACVQVANTGALVLDHVAVRHCIAYGGSGGNGGTGGQGNLNFMAPPLSAGGAGGNSGAGGDVTGGAVLVYGSLSLLNSSVVDGQAYGGGGGAGAAGGIGDSGGNFVFGASGVSGAGGAANGGAVFVAAGSLRITNSTIAGGSGTGGMGGAGVTNTQDVTFGGGGGAATGGLIRLDASAVLADLEFSTFAGGQVVGGSGGSGVGGHAGPPGTPSGNAISAANTTTALSSVIVDVQSGVSLCDGQVAAAASSVNLSEDSSCSGFTLQGTFAQLFHPLDVSTTPWPGYMPLYHSTVIDAAATCLDLAALPVANDQHDTLRPQGANCDLGAIEADYIFVDGFE